ncbi:MAG TPA: hypothetical protein VEX68_23165 [Bryobacteraceae bacterium]|nr:hypothetical protein [Bryobacteraceae bacterium]
MIVVLVLAVITGIGSAFLAHMRRGRLGGISAVAGAISLASGLATTLALTAHVISVTVSNMAAHEPVVYDTEQAGLLALGIAILIPGLICLTQAGAVLRGELHAQKRALAASIVIAGFLSPIASNDPLAALVALLALANIAALLASPTNGELSAPQASLHY